MIAAQALGCSPLELANDPNASYWLRAGTDFGRFKAWAQQKQRP